MSIIDLISLFVIMLALAALPSASVVLVVTRSAILGVPNGVAVSLGIVLGDIVFVLLAILGMSVLAETMGSVFLVIKYIAGAYLIYLGYQLIRSGNKNTITVNANKLSGNLLTSFFAGFFLTLGDVKAIFFYASLFPVFVDLSALNIWDISIIIVITVMSVGGVKCIYAVLAKKLAEKSQGLVTEKYAKKTAGLFMLGAGSYLIIKT